MLTLGNGGPLRQLCEQMILCQIIFFNVLSQNFENLNNLHKIIFANIPRFRRIFYKICLTPSRSFYFAADIINHSLQEETGLAHWLNRTHLLLVPVNILLVTPVRLQHCKSLPSKNVNSVQFFLSKQAVCKNQSSITRRRLERTRYNIDNSSLEEVKGSSN